MSLKMTDLRFASCFDNTAWINIMRPHYICCWQPKKKMEILAETLTEKYLEGWAHTEQRIWLCMESGQGFGIEIPEWNRSVHVPTLMHPFKFLYNYSASRSHSNSIPHHSNAIPVNPEVSRIPYKVAQFLTLSSGKVHITRHFQFHTINSTIYRKFWPLQLCFLSCILDFWTVAYTCTHELADMCNLLSCGIGWNYRILL